MHVVIIGAGEVGWYLADRLQAEDHDVVVVENDQGRAAAISEQLDVQVVNGSGSVPSVLADAGVGQADFLAAVTQNDEVNLVACLMAKKHGVATTVVRLQDPELRAAASGSLLAAVGADTVIDPDADTADEILELLHLQGADEVYPMAGGDLLVIGAVIGEDAPVAGRNLADIARDHEPNWEFLFGAVTRGDVTTIPRGDQELLEGDHVRVLVTRDARQRTLELLGVPGGYAKRVMILGGGAIGSRLARHLEDEGVEIVLVERDRQRATHLSETLRRSLVVVGEVTDTDLLTEESIGRMDAVIATTGEDASNVMACAYASAEGAAFTVAVLHRLALLPLIRQFGINAAVSPRTASANTVLRQLRGGVAAVTTFLESDAEVDQLELEPGAKADGIVVADLHLPPDVLLGAVVRDGEEGEIVRGSTILHAGDHVIVFARPDSLAVARGYFASPRNGGR